jgi:hypothetical protein
MGPSPTVSGTMTPALALSELQAVSLQAAPIGLVSLNDPDMLLTNVATISTDKTNQYRLGVNQPVVTAASCTIDFKTTGTGVAATGTAVATTTGSGLKPTKAPCRC